MKRLVYRIVERLRDPDHPLSRNRNYATFEAPDGQAALRINRQISSLERSILGDGEPESLRVSNGGDRVRIDVKMPRVHAHRTTFLSPDEFELLLRSPSVGPLLQAALGEE